MKLFKLIKNYFLDVKAASGVNVSSPWSTVKGHKVEESTKVLFDTHYS